METLILYDWEFKVWKRMSKCHYYYYYYYYYYYIFLD